jgi:hypothetical protein
VVNLLNSHIKSNKAQPEPPQRNGAFGFIRSLVGLTSSHPKEDDEQLNPPPSNNGEAYSLTVTEEERLQKELLQAELAAEESNAEEAPWEALEHTTPSRGGQARYSPTTESHTPEQPDASPTPTATISTAPKRLATPKTRPGDLAKAKRKQPPERKDMYALSGTEDEDGGLFDGVPKRPSKRLKVVKKKEARVPLVPPKRTTATAGQDQCRHEDENISAEMRHFKTTEGASEPGPSDTLCVDDNPVEPLSAKKRRGRPRKHPVQPANTEDSKVALTMNEPPESPTSHQTIADHTNSPTLPRPSANGVAPRMKNPVPLAPAQGRDGDESVDKGVDPILLGPSPKKPPHLPNKATDWNIPDDPEDEVDSEPQPQPQPQSQPGRLNSSEPQRHSERPASLPEAGKYADCLKAFDKMISTLNRVGRKYTKEADRYTLVRTVNQANAKEGERVERRIRALVTAYDGLRASIDGGERAIEDAQGKVTDIVTTLKEECNQLLTARLGKPDEGFDYFDDDSTEQILTDLYFILIPKFVRALKFGVDVYNGHGSMDYNALCEFTELLDLLYKLVVTALGQPRTSQPSGGGTYQTVKPIQGVLPTLREVRTKFRTEVKVHKRRQEQAKRARAREKFVEQQELQAVEEERREDRREAKRLANMKRVSLEQHRLRIQQDEEQQAGRRRRNAERVKLQKEDLARKFADPIWGPLKQSEVKKALAKEAARYPERQGRQARASAETIESSSRRRNDDVEDDPFADDGFERVSVFGKKNTRKDQVRKEVSDTDMATFVNIMSSEHGEDRYEKAANQLNHSIEEIFELAKGT